MGNNVHCVLQVLLEYFCNDKNWCEFKIKRRLSLFLFSTFTGGAMPKSDCKMKIPVYEYELKLWTVHCLSFSYYVMFLQLNSVVTLTVFPSRLLPALPCKVPAEGLKKWVFKQVIKGMNLPLLIRI